MLVKYLINSSKALEGIDRPMKALSMRIQNGLIDGRTHAWQKCKKKSR